MAHISEAVDESGFGMDITEVVSGGCEGIDTLAEEWADWMGIPMSRFGPDWIKYGKPAGPIRNQQMADYADALIAIRAPGKSDGTDDMIAKAEKRGLKVFVKRL